ncbi:hypothetical protein GIB67_015655 [Kingdonia uniflora]|uniref:Sister chromatid cohesion protein n=1 Tax=Kingdonia uniflora TaxID=39325 RepID=A0A7J7NUB8_9MAGN|nr:hypothetical protein GIB67_015655 [Kingdonia uniflora]
MPNSFQGNIHLLIPSIWTYMLKIVPKLVVVYSYSYFKLAADWPPMMQIVQLISQDHMNNKHYDGKTDFLVFKALNQHGFFGQLQEKNLIIEHLSPSCVVAWSSFCRKFVRKFDSPSCNQSVIPFLMYCTEILALLPFTVPDEPLYLIYTINRVLQVRSKSLEATMKALSSPSIQEDKHAISDENGVLQHDSSVLQQEPYSSAHSVTIHINEEDAIMCSPTLGVSCGILKDNLQSNQADCQAVIAFQLHLKLKRHLKIAFGLSDARCLEFSSNDPLKSGEALSRQNIPFDISGTHFSLPTSYKEIIERYQGKTDRFFPGGASLHSCMTPHGPDTNAFEATVAKGEDPGPFRITDTMAFMFESSLIPRVFPWALDSPYVDHNYYQYWIGLKSHFSSEEKNYKSKIRIKEDETSN